MAGHYRVALKDTKMGQPEVNLGIIPGAEGTQRLPRLVGVEKAIDMCVSGKPIGAPEALAAGLVDRLINGDLRAGAVAFARDAATGGIAPPKTRDRRDRLGTPESNAPIFAAGRELATANAAQHAGAAQGCRCHRGRGHAAVSGRRSPRARDLLRVPSFGSVQGARARVLCRAGRSAKSPDVPKRHADGPPLKRWRSSAPARWAAASRPRAPMPACRSSSPMSAAKPSIGGWPAFDATTTRRSSAAALSQRRSRPADRPDSRTGRIRGRRVRRSGDRSGLRKSRPQERGVRLARRGGEARLHSGHEHVHARHRRDRVGDHAARVGHRHAFLQPGARDAAGRDRPRPRDRARMSWRRRSPSPSA